MVKINKCVINPLVIITPNCDPCPHTRLRARDHPTSSTLIGGKRRTRSKFAASHYTWGTNGVHECKMDVKVYIDSYMTSTGSCFMVTWTIFKNHLQEAGQTQNRKTMALRTLTAVGFFYFLSRVKTRVNRNPLKQHLVNGPVTHGLPLHSKICDHTTTRVWRRLGTAFGHFLCGLSQSHHGHGSWLVCEAALG